MSSGLVAARRMLVLTLVSVALLGCSPRHLIIEGIGNELASQGQAPEDDLVLAREASAFYLKLSESLLRESPGNARLAEAVAAGFTQYAYAFVAFDAEQIEASNAQAAQALRERAARLYLRAHQHAMRALELASPGFRSALATPQTRSWPQLRKEHIGLAYWAAASWGAYISLSKDQPDTVADLPLAVRLASLAWALEPDHGQGALSSLMGSFEAARAGGSPAQAAAYFDRAMAAGAGRNAGVFVARAEALALPAGDRPAFEALLHQALQASAQQRDLPNEVMRARARWLLARADDLF